MSSVLFSPRTSNQISFFEKTSLGENGGEKKPFIHAICRQKTREGERSQLTGLFLILQFRKKTEVGNKFTYHININEKLAVPSYLLVL